MIIRCSGSEKCISVFETSEAVSEKVQFICSNCMPKILSEDVRFQDCQFDKEIGGYNETMRDEHGAIVPGASYAPKRQGLQ